MKTMYRMWVAAAIGLLATACSSENEVFDEKGQLIELAPVHPASTRVTDTNFESNDQIGVFMTAEGTDLQIGGNELNNELFSYNGTSWTAPRKAYWNDGKHNIYAYYPYASNIVDVKNYEFTVSEDQNVTGEIMSGYEASDFLWASAVGVAASKTPVSLKFSHCMSRVKVKLEKAEGYNGEIPTDCQVFIHNMVPTALVDLQTGMVEASPYAGVKTVKCREISDTEFVACIVPQRISSRRPIVEVATSGVSYLLEGTISLKQGYQSTIIVKLSKTPQQVAIEIGGSTQGWS